MRWRVYCPLLGGGGGVPYIAAAAGLCASFLAFQVVGDVHLLLGDVSPLLCWRS